MDTAETAEPTAQPVAGTAAPPTYPRPFYLIVQLQMEVLKRLERAMKPTGVTPAVGRVLNAIATRPHISSSDLARMFGISPQSVKQSIRLLEQRGLIIRTAQKDDQRVLAAQLTERGWTVRDRHREIIAAMYDSVFAGISDAEMHELTRLLIDVLRHARPSALDYYADLAAQPAAAAGPASRTSREAAGREKRRASAGGNRGRVERA